MCFLFLSSELFRILGRKTFEFLGIKVIARAQKNMQPGSFRIVSLPLVKNGEIELTVRVERKNGFQGAVYCEMDWLPNGVQKQPFRNKTIQNQPNSPLQVSMWPSDHVSRMNQVQFVSMDKVQVPHIINRGPFSVQNGQPWSARSKTG